MNQLPNLLSAARLVVAPYLWYLIFAGEYELALWWFAAAGVSDALDGWLARRWRVESAVGRVLDPIADKVLLSGAFLSLAFGGAISWWLAALVLGRDALILVGAGALLVFSQRKRSFPPSLWGKLSTIAQVSFVLAVVTTRAGWPFGVATDALSAATVALTVWSGVDYARRLA